MLYYPIPFVYVDKRLLFRVNKQAFVEH